MLYRPSTGPISSAGSFGWRQLPGEGPTYHGGIDFVGALGSPVRAVKDGVIFVAAPNGTYNRYGNLIVLKHDDPSEAPYSLYAHLNSMRVRKGQRVRAGQIIGAMGNTSADRCGPGAPPTCNPNHKVATHLHFELLKAFPAMPDVGRVDPTAYLAPAQRAPMGTSGPAVQYASATPVLYPAVSDQGPLLYPSYSGGPVAGLGSTRWTSNVPRPFATAPGTGLSGVVEDFMNADADVKVLIAIGLLPFAVAALRSLGVIHSHQEAYA
jgi:murein DD-endopeptidase MepM/ murein hydrolase activator NlpD